MSRLAVWQPVVDGAMFLLLESNVVNHHGHSVVPSGVSDEVKGELMDPLGLTGVAGYP